LRARVRHGNVGWLNTSQVSQRDGVLTPHRPGPPVTVATLARIRATLRVALNAAIRARDPNPNPQLRGGVVAP